MRKGFTSKTLTVLGAALLSGSVFAAGPVVDGIPSVIITDKMSAAEVEANPTTPFDYLATETQNIYRFTDALSLTDYVALPDGGDIATVKWLFTESETDGTLITGTDRAIVIDEDKVGEESVPDFAAVTGSGYDLVTEPLDFRNDAANPTQTYLADPAIPLPDNRLLTVFAASTDAEVEDTVGVGVFEVITTNEAEFLSDGLSAATSIFDPVDCIEGFDSWQYTAVTQILNSFVTPPTLSTAVAAPSRTPNVALGGTAPAGTADLGHATVANAGSSGIAGISPQIAFWESAGTGVGIPTTKGNIYLARWQVSTTASASDEAAVAAQENIRFRMGQSTTAGAGVAVDEVTKGENHIDDAGRGHRSYYYAHEDDDIFLAFDAVDITDVGLINTTLSQVELFAADRSGLSGTVLFNQGAAAVTVFGDTPAPPDDIRFDFNTTNLWTTVNATGQSGRSFSTAGTGGSVLVATSSQTSTAATNHLSWESSAQTASAGISAVNDVTSNAVLALDVYMSSPQGSSATNSLPPIRVQLLAPGTAGRDAYFEFNAAKDAAAANLLSLEATSKRYTAMIEPQLRDSAGTIDFNALILFLYYNIVPDGSGGFVNTDNGTVNVNRVVITQYDLEGLDALAADCQ
jgi:hypothetical protein